MFCVLKVGKGRMCICIKKPGSIHKKFIDAINHMSGFVQIGVGARRVDFELYTFFFNFIYLYGYAGLSCGNS